MPTNQNEICIRSEDDVPYEDEIPELSTAEAWLLLRPSIISIFYTMITHEHPGMRESLKLFGDAIEKLDKLFDFDDEEFYESLAEHFSR